LSGERRLLVHGQRWRADSNGYADLRERCSRQGQHYEREQQRADRRDETHYVSFGLIILGLPGDALLLRVAWMKGAIPNETH